MGPGRSAVSAAICECGCSSIMVVVGSTAVGFKACRTNSSRGETCQQGAAVDESDMARAGVGPSLRIVCF